MQQKISQKRQNQEDEINLIEFWKILVSSKVLIATITLIVTIIASVHIFTVTPIYEAKALVEIGNYRTTSHTSDKGDIVRVPIDSAPELIKKLEVIFMEFNDDKLGSNTTISSLTAFKGMNNFIEIKSESSSNDLAVEKIEEVVKYIKQLHKNFISEIKIIMNNEANNINKLGSDFNSLNILQQLRALGVSGFLGYEFRNSTLVGEIRTKDYPIKPNKREFIIITFIASLILSIFLAFIMNIIRNAKKSAG
jgi:capsular polysaccharide biosynthesis protein